MNLEDELRAADEFIAEYQKRFSVDEPYVPIVEGFELPSMPPGRDGLLGLSRLDALERIVVLMRLLRAEVTTSHYEVWRFCAMYADRRWDSMGAIATSPSLRGTEDTFYCAAAVFLGTLVPPQTSVDSLVRHTMLGPLGFTLIEGALRRGSNGHLREDGSVAREFQLPTPTSSEPRIYAPSRPARTRCRGIEDAFVLQLQLLSATEPTVARALEALGSETLAVLGSSTQQVWQSLDEWRDAWLKAPRRLRNQVPILANLLAFLLLAHMSDRDYADTVALAETDADDIATARAGVA
jgi:hypothetical protein